MDWLYNLILFEGYSEPVPGGVVHFQMHLFGMYSSGNYPHPPPTFKSNVAARGRPPNL